MQLHFANERLRPSETGGGVRLQSRACPGRFAGGIFWQVLQINSVKRFAKSNKAAIFATDLFRGGLQSNRRDGSPCGENPFKQ